MKKNSRQKKVHKPKPSIKSVEPSKTKEAFKTHISFHFKDLKNPSIEYAAHYVSGGIPEQRFHVDILQSRPTILFSRNEAWTKFHENATFDDIFEGLRTYDIHDVAASSGIPDFTDYQKWTDRKFLKELSLYPEWLDYETGATTRLIFLLKTIQVANSDAARKARENLKQCLIPTRPGKRKSYPENLEEGLFILKDLSKYIGSKCRGFLRDGDIPDEYLELQKWGKIEEPRIVGMLPKDLALLVYSPVSFVEARLSKELYVSIASLKSALRERKKV
jgi:hypothetical protein